MEVQEAIPQPGQAPSSSSVFPCLAQQIQATGRKVLLWERLLTLGWDLDYGVPHSPGVIPNPGWLLALGWFLDLVSLLFLEWLLEKRVPPSTPPQSLVLSL